ncbi:MAG: phospholipase D family protein [Candidatus Bathyarchaeia archaeon]|nr:phospholipase D family protein [Candidatus Bathyarchaeota archaeon]
MKKITILVLLILSFLAGVITSSIVWRNTQINEKIFIAQTITITKCPTKCIENLSSIFYEVYFSPNGGCEKRLIYWFNKANFSIHVMIYSFTLDSISDALIAAYKRGVEVKVIIEKEQLNEYSEYYKLKNAGIEVKLDANPALMHNKVAIIDGIIVITGSYNWSLSAETKNNENMIIIKNAEVAKIYEEEFQKIWRESIW